MAATWTVHIDVLGLATQRIRVTATRTDDADPDNPFVHTTEGSTDTTVHTLPEIRDMLVAQCVAEYQAQAARQAHVDAVVTTYEAALAAALNAEEPL